MCCQVFLQLSSLELEACDGLSLVLTPLPLSGSNLVVCCPLQAGVCMCEEGFTEVLSPGGQLDQCAPIPVLEIPTAGDKKGDVKTSRAVNPTLPSTILPGRTGRTWYLQPYGPGQSAASAPHTHPASSSSLLSDIHIMLEHKKTQCFVAVKWKSFSSLTGEVTRLHTLHFPAAKW